MYTKNCEGQMARLSLTKLIGECGVMIPNARRMMTGILEAVVEPDGTVAAGAVDNAVIAGKTGTTNSNKDMWFCGYSAYYTTAVWIGFDYPKEIQGHNSASYIFKQYMTQVHENLPRREISILFGFRTE